MDFEENLTEEQKQQLKIQKDLIKLAKVLDSCIEYVDEFYCYTLKKQMLTGSNDN